jgi:hypothetical protein
MLGPKLSVCFPLLYIMSTCRASTGQHNTKREITVDERDQVLQRALSRFLLRRHLVKTKRLSRSVDSVRHFDNSTRRRQKLDLERRDLEVLKSFRCRLPTLTTKD